MIGRGKRDMKEDRRILLVEDNPHLFFMDYIASGYLEDYGPCSAASTATSLRN